MVSCRSKAVLSNQSKNSQKENIWIRNVLISIFILDSWLFGIEYQQMQSPNQIPGFAEIDSVKEVGK